MNNAAELLARAQAAGLLPATARWPQVEQRPWPIVLLTALGAWLVALPLTAMLMMLLGDALRDGPGPYLLGAAVLGGAVHLLRRPGLPLFVEQLTVPGLLIGGGCIAMGLFGHLGGRSAAALLLVLALLVAVGVARAWLRVLLGALAAGLAAFVLLPWRGAASGLWPWPSVYLLLGLWALALLLQRRRLLAGPRAARAALIEALACGWLLQCLLILCGLAGMTMFVGGLFGGASGLAQAVWSPVILLPSAGSAVLALAAAFLAQRAWPGLRQWGLLGAALVLGGLAWLMPSLGGVLFALALLACSGRWHQAAAAAVAAAWVIGAFYYQLQWPLADKALLLAGAGALLGLLAWCLRARRAGPAGLPQVQQVQQARPGPAAIGLLGGVMLVLVVANLAIRQKEQLIAAGRPVFVALAPVDPRSLMQGDFMRLNFALLVGLDEPLLRWPGTARPRLVLRLDAQGQATPLRLEAEGTALAADELLIELTPKNGRWILVSDAWFFREGEARRFEAARFGEFRVLPDGRALLVGLADAQLRPIAP